MRTSGESTWHRQVLVRCYLSICVATTGCTWVYGNVKDYFAVWVFDSANRALKSLKLTR